MTEPRYLHPTFGQLADAAAAVEAFTSGMETVIAEKGLQLAFDTTALSMLLEKMKDKARDMAVSKEDFWLGPHALGVRLATKIIDEFTAERGYLRLQHSSLRTTPRIWVTPKHVHDRGNDWLDDLGCPHPIIY